MLNKNRASVYPQAEADIELPKVLTEKDRALMAHGLIRTIGSDRNVDDYFEVPGYKLKRFDLNGKGMRERILEESTASRIFKDGGFQVSALEPELQ